MRIHSRAKPLLVLLCVLLVSLFFFSSVLTATHSGHSCRQDRCTVCATLQSLHHIMRRLALLAMGIALAMASAVAAHAVFSSSVAYRQPTPITLKVRMNP